MGVLSAIEGRRSIRKYTGKAIEQEKLEKVLEAARLAPSAGNAQNWRFIVVTDKTLIKQLQVAAGGQEFVGQAPAIIVACGTEPSEIMLCGQHRYTIDLSIAVAYLILEAYELGLGTCWIGRFDEKAVKKILGIDERVRVVAITPLGYADENPSKRPRKNVDEIVSYNEY